MISVAVFGNIRAAKAVSDYLHVNKIYNEIKQEDDGFHLLLAENANFDQAKTLMDEFVQNPHADKFLTASWERNQVEDISAGQHQQSLSSVFKTVYQQTGSFSRITSLVIFLIFIAEVLGFSRWLFLHLGFPVHLQQLEFSEIYRLITPALMHGDWAHLILNLFWWLWLGGQLERCKGALWLLNLSLVSALIAHLLQYSLVSSNFIGLSGVVYGLLGYTWLAKRYGRLSQINLPNGIIIMMLLWIVVGFTDVLGLRMANWAHLGGLIAGVLWAVVENFKSKVNP